MNSSLARDTLIGSYGIGYKVQILFALIQGMWTSMTLSGLVILFLIAVLTGANLSLLFEKIVVLNKFDKLQVVVGGNSLLELSFLSIFLLSVSLFVLIRSRNSSCVVNYKK